MRRTFMIAAVAMPALLLTGCFFPGPGYYDRGRGEYRGENRGENREYRSGGGDHRPGQEEFRGSDYRGGYPSR